MELLNALQWREPNIVTPAGASGGFDADGRPSIYKRSLQMLESGIMRAEPLITHRYDTLGSLQHVLDHEMTHPDYLKGIMHPYAIT